MIRILTGLALATGVLLTWPGQLEAAEGYDSCTGFINSLPATISTQGTWCLHKSLSTTTEDVAIRITGNNVTIDCNGFRIDGLADDPIYSIGIYAHARLNATARNCTIHGFVHGISLPFGGNHLVEDNTIDGNTVSGIELFESPGSIIRNNIVTNTGSSANTTHDFSRITAIYAKHGVDIINNTVNGVVASGNADAQLRVTGISIHSGNAIGNRVRGLATRGGSYLETIGIEAWGGTAVAFKNIVQGPGTAASNLDVGIYCPVSSDTDSAHQNVVLGFGTGIDDDCFATANHTNPN